MLELATILIYPFCTFIGLCSLILALTRFRWWQREKSNLDLYYQTGSEFVEGVVKRCKTLQEGYHPVPPWGWIGHVQTIMFGAVGRTSASVVKGERHSIVVVDGSTVYYDVYEPRISEEERQKREKESGTASPITFFVIPGINNCSEQDYMRVFVRYCTNLGYRVIIFNHLGALPVTLTANRIFTYGGTGDLGLVFDDVCERFPNDRLAGCGFSLGACILVRFLGESKKRQSKFLCAASLCQGYDPSMHIPSIRDWEQLRRLYSLQITRGHRKLIRRHSSKLFLNDDAHSNGQAGPSSTPTASQNGHSPLPHHLWNGFKTEVVHGDYNSNGCSLDPSRCLAPDQAAMMSATNMVELDEAYTRRVLGFPSVPAMYRWVSCSDLIDEISDLPLLNLNSWDDPCVTTDTHEIPKRHAREHSKSLFVLSKYGGHLGFFEGSFFWPRSETWIDRLMVEYAEACLASEC